MTISPEQDLKNKNTYESNKHKPGCSNMGVYCCEDWKKYFLSFSDTRDFSPEIKISKVNYYLKEILPKKE